MLVKKLSSATFACGVGALVIAALFTARAVASPITYSYDLVEPSNFPSPLDSKTGGVSFGGFSGLINLSFASNASGVTNLSGLGLPQGYSLTAAAFAAALQNSSSFSYSNLIDSQEPSGGGDPSPGTLFGITVGGATSGISSTNSKTSNANAPLVFVTPQGLYLANGALLVVGGIEDPGTSHQHFDYIQWTNGNFTSGGDSGAQDNTLILERDTYPGEGQVNAPTFATTMFSNNPSWEIGIAAPEPTGAIALLGIALMGGLGLVARRRWRSVANS